MGLHTLPTKTPKQELTEVIVKNLEGLLARARRGEVESLLLLYETSDYEGMNWSTAGTLSRSQTIGRIEILKARLLMELLAEDEG